MTIIWMAYTLLLGVLIATCGFAIEKIGRIGRVPLRWGWLAAIAVSCVVPVALALRGPPPTNRIASGTTGSSASHGAPAPGRPTSNTAASDASVLASPPDAVAAPPAASGMQSAPNWSVLRQLLGSERLNAALLILWAMSSCVTVGLFLRSYRALRFSMRSWRTYDLDGHSVFVSEDFGPAVVGLLRPRVVLPAWALDLDSESRQMVLAHELEHSRAADPLLTLAGAACAALMPWNPAIWLQFARLRAAIEIDCDARVLRRIREPRQYAALLFAVGTRAATRVSWLPALSERRSLLERRILAMSEQRPARPGVASLPAISLFALCALLAVRTAAPDPMRSRLLSALHRSFANAQAPLRRLTATQDLVISSETDGFYDLKVSGSGEILTLERGRVPRVFSANGQEILRIESGLPDDLRSLYWGWAGDSIWIFQTDAMQVLMIDAQSVPPVVTARPVPYETPGPPGTTPQGRRAAGAGVPGVGAAPTAVAPRAAGPRYTHPFINAVYADGGLLIRQQFPPEEVRNALGYQGDVLVPQSLLIRTNADNQFVSFALSAPPRTNDPCKRTTGEQGHYVPIKTSLPFCTDYKYAVSPDGQRLVTVSTAIPVTDPATVRVSQIAFGGRESIYARSYRVSTLGITSEEADSIRSAERARLSRSPDERLQIFSDSILEFDMPQYRTPVSEVYAGNDGTVVLTLLRFTTERYYLFIDRRGNAVGTFVLPANVLPVEVRGDAVYGVVLRADSSPGENLNDIVRYRIR
jgi:beta-lactamase regulating signal transducer with metallopeptidase domain